MFLQYSLSLCALLVLQTPADDPVRSALEIAVGESPDGTDVAETPGYRELVGALLKLKPADVEARQPGALDAVRLLADPAAGRGTWVRMRGFVMLKHATVLKEPIGELQKIEHIILRPDAKTRVFVDLIGDPPPFKNQADTVEISGVFFRSVSYKNANGVQVTLPYVLARSMELVDTPSSTLAKSLITGGRQLLVGIVFGVLGVVALVFYLRRSAKSET